MTPEEFKRAESIFQAACALPELERAAFADLACGQDAELRSHLRLLLEHDERPAVSLEAPTVAVELREQGETLLQGQGAQRDHPARIGSYRIQKLLGEGGFGVVYLAEQERPRRTVAVKVLRPGLFSRNLLRRFEYEAQVLARLQHPGIAQIYEAGAVDPAQPDLAFIAMEYVSGVALTEYAEARRLSVRDRIGLMVKVCEAVEHAHQRGIIHRDLKPANILVAAGDEEGIKGSRDRGTEGQAAHHSPLTTHHSWDGQDACPTAQPKILDFGVARATDADLAVTTMHTHSGQLVGTLPYMSPEQVAGDPEGVDTRSDVYALGVILYRVLTGRLPYELPPHSIPEAARIIREEEPSRLGSVNRTLRGDLETIVAKALEKDKARRYPSAAELGADLQRYLRNEPIAARPPSSIYQLSKFARRHKALVGALAGVFAVLVAGVVVSTSYYLSAERARADAVHARDQAEIRRVEADTQRTEAERQAAIATAINTFLNRDLLRAVDPRTAKDRDVTVREVLDQAAREVEGGSLRDRPEVEAEVRSTIGVTYRQLGLFAQAAPHLRAAVDLLSRLHGERDPSVLENMKQLGEALFHKGDYSAAEPVFRSALEIQRTILGERHPYVGSGLTNLALLLQAKGDYPAAQPLLDKALEIARTAPDRQNSEMADLLSALGSLLEQKGEREEARKFFIECLETRRKVLPDGHPQIALSLVELAKVVRDGGDPAGAEPLYREAIDMQRRRLGEAHPDLAVSLNHLANLLSNQGRSAEAAPLLDKALIIQRKLLGPDHPEVATSTNNLAVLYWELGKDEEAEPLFQEALVLLLKHFGDEHPRVATARNNLSSLLRAKGDHDGAEALVREALRAARNSLGDEHPLVAGNLNNLASILGAKGDYPEAEPLARESLALHGKLFGDDHVNTAFALATLGTILSESDRAEEGEQRLRECLRIRSAAVPPGHWLIGDALSRLGACLTMLACFEEAEELLLASYAILKNNPQARRDLQARTLEHIAALYSVWGRPDPMQFWSAPLSAQPVE